MPEPRSLSLRPLPEQHRYEVVQGGWFQAAGHPPVFIPEGFKTDGASIPRFFWRVIGTPFQPEIITAATAHDVLYHSSRWKRWRADAMFRDLLMEHGVGWVRAHLMWFAVRAFGGLFWHRCQKGDGR